MTTTKELYNKVFGTLFHHGMNEEEADRVFDEIALFGDRGWEPFILLLSEVMTQKRDWPIEMAGSAKDSYLLYLATASDIEDGGKNHDKLNDQKGRDILFNDALRFNVNIISAFPDVVDSEENNILECIRSTAEKLNLTVRKLDETDLWLAIGKGKEIPDSDVETIKNEKPESTPKEADILRKYLLIKIKKWNGI